MERRAMKKPKNAEYFSHAYSGNNIAGSSNWGIVGA
jgi:hypothetical protein